MRNNLCPICGSDSGFVLKLRFGPKMNLPTNIEIRHCALDNFLFVAKGNQTDYDEYYMSIANDSYHSEVSGTSARSVISNLQKGHLAQVLAGFFDAPRKVLDFGCGEASLLVELAREFPSSTFIGFDPSPAAQTGNRKAADFSLKNMSVVDLRTCSDQGPYDLVIVSHVIEHLIEFDLLSYLKGLLTKNGLLYVEVPDSLRYETYERREFLYYFDRIHVNHFSPESLTRLCAGYDFGYVNQIRYSFPYRDGGQYPALGMLFRKEQDSQVIGSASILEAATSYIESENVRAKAVARQFDAFEGVLVWGAGDNFHRSCGNDGPLSNIQNVVLLDKRQQEVVAGGRNYPTVHPAEGIRHYQWPVVVTVSVERKAISDQIHSIDPHRPVFFV